MALFPTSQKALAWALLHTPESIKAPAMSRAAAEAQRVRDWHDAGGRKSTRQRDENLVGANATGQAAFILLEFAKLSNPQRLTCYARVLPSRLPCSCSSPCCSGWRKGADWAAAITGLCSYLKDFADVQRNGKRGHSSHPVLRQRLVEAFFGAQAWSVPDLAQACDVSSATVYNHRHVITEHLRDVEQTAWAELDALLVERDIVGSV